MNACLLLTELHNRGIRVESRCNGNLYVAPKALLTPELIETIRTHKAELLAVLMIAPEVLARLQAMTDDPADCVIRLGSDLVPGNRPLPATTDKAAVCPPRAIRKAIAPELQVKIEAIEAEARRLGWPTERLWNASFWDQPRGLLAVMDPDDEIIEVTADTIRILKLHRHIQTFRRQNG
jgi:hypothetical protein